MDIAKIFVNGRSQAVRLPKEYRLEDSEVYVKKIGDVILLIPKKSVWKTFAAGLNYFSNDFLEEKRNQPNMQKRDDF